MVADQEEEDANVAEMKEARAAKSKKGRAAWANRVAAYCEAHGQYMEFQRVIIELGPYDNLVDLLHGIDINLPEKIMKFSFHDPVLLDSNPDLREQVAAFYTYIGCSLDLRPKGERERARKWFHDSVWHYDFVLGQNKLSFGLDMNILILALICYGTAELAADTLAASGSRWDCRRLATAASQGWQEAPSPCPAAGPADGNPAAALLSACVQGQIHIHRLVSLRSYAEVAQAHNEKWESDSQAYKDARACRAYWAGMLPSVCFCAWVRE